MAGKSMNNEPGAKVRSKKWVDSHTKIEAFLVKKLKMQAYMPTYKEISEGTGVSVKTVYTHMKEMQFEVQRPELSILTRSVVLKLYSRLMGGDFAKWELQAWFAIVEGMNIEGAAIDAAIDSVQSGGTVIMLPNNNRGIDSE